MGTLINDYLLQLSSRWSEVDILIEEADKANAENPELYNAICRSISTLIVAHMEGFIKDLAKNIVHDLNYNACFSDLPEAVKKTYCKKYLGFDNSIHSKYEALLNEMVDEFSGYQDFKLSYEPFLFDKNRNPKPDSLDVVFKRFGIQKIFDHLNASIFDACFESRVATQRYLRRMKQVLNLSTQVFPYKSSLKKFNLKKNKVTGGRTLWQEYLDDLNAIRHKIVHGNTFDNEISYEQLVDNRNKAQLLQLILTYCLTAEMSRQFEKVS